MIFYQRSRYVFVVLLIFLCLFIVITSGCNSNSTNPNTTTETTNSGTEDATTTTSLGAGGATTTTSLEAGGATTTTIDGGEATSTTTSLEAGGATTTTTTSSEVTTTTAPSDPFAPTGVSATDDLTDKITITWNSVGGFERYHIFRAASLDGNYSELGTSTSTSYDDTTASLITDYYYKIKAYSSSQGYSSFSNCDAGFIMENYVFVRKFGTYGSGNGQLNNPLGITIFNNPYDLLHTYHTIFVSDYNYRIAEFDFDGNFIKTWGSSGYELGKFMNPEGIAMNPFGYQNPTYNLGVIYVAEGGGDIQACWTDTRSIFRYDNGVHPIHQGPDKGNLTTPRDITFVFERTQDGALASRAYVVDAGEMRIAKFDGLGDLLATFGSGGYGTGQMQCPMAIDSYTTAGGDKFLYVTSAARNVVLKFSIEGTFIKEWGGTGSGNGQFNDPVGITVDQNGNVYVADNGNNRIQKFNSEGKFLAKWGSSGTGDGQFNKPFHLEVDQITGYVCVTDRLNHRVQIFQKQ